MEVAAQMGQFGPEGRRARRRMVNLAAALEDEGQQATEVRVLDLSELGFRMSGQELAVGAAIWIKLPGLEAAHAQVMWAEGGMCGCEFESPLHPSSIELVASARAPRRPAGFRKLFGTAAARPEARGE